MNQQLLSFYASLSPGGQPHAVVMAEAVSEPPAAVTETKVPAQHHVTPCPYGITTGCQRVFRSKKCCEAVQDHDCDPPEELLPRFAEGNGPVTMAQVYIAHGYHR